MMPTHDFGQCRDDFPEGGQRLVNIGALLETGAFCAGGVGTLGAGQINQGNLRDLDNSIQ